MINLTLDTSCFDKKSKPLFDTLQNFEDQGFIKKWHDLFSEIETERWINKNKKEIQELFKSHSNVKLETQRIPSYVGNDPKKIMDFFEKKQGYTFEELYKTHLKIDKILYPEGFHGKKIVNKYIDEELLAKHIITKRDFFVTKDQGFIKKGKKEKLEKEFPRLKIRILNQEFLEELKKLLS